MIHFTRVILLLTVFLIPLLSATSDFGYEQIKVLFFIAGVSLASVFWMLDGKSKIDWASNTNKTAGLFIISLLIASFLGVNPKVSILGALPYFQGFILYAYLFLFFILVKDSKIKLKLWAKILVTSSILVSFVAIKDWILLNLFNQQIPAYAGRVVSTFGQPNFYGGFLLLTLPFSYFLLKNPVKKLHLLGWVSGVISMIGIMVSYSRSAILLALVLLILSLIDQLKIKIKLAVVIFGAVFLSILLGLRFLSGIVSSEFSRPFLTNNPDLTYESIEKRVYIWPIAWKLILKQPLIGYGLENIGFVFSKYFIENKHPLFEENLNVSPVMISLKELIIDRSHNYLFDLLLFSGILGLFGWLFLVGLMLKKAKGILLVSLGTYLIWIQFQNQSIVHFIYFWLLVGLIDIDSNS